MTLALARRDRLALLGAGVALSVILLALCGPLLAPHEPSAIVGPPYAAPGPGMPLGTDYLGEDVLSRVLWGGRSVVWMSLCATAIGVVLGTAAGLVAGYARNRLDDAIVWVLDVLMAFPQIVFVLLFLSILSRDPWLIVVLVALGWLPVVARLARAVTLETVNEEFVQAVELIGVTRRRILFREILPNIAVPLLVQAGVLLTWSIGLIAGLSFLGFGIQPPNADWGRMVKENFTGLSIQPWSVVAPIACIALFALGTNTLAERISRRVGGTAGSAP